MIEAHGGLVMVLGGLVVVLGGLVVVHGTCVHYFCCAFFQERISLADQGGVVSVLERFVPRVELNSS